MAGFHKESAGLVKRADLIVVEDLKVANMIRHPTLARSIADASWSRFVSMLDYKVAHAAMTRTEVARRAHTSVSVLRPGHPPGSQWQLEYSPRRDWRGGA